MQNQFTRTHSNMAKGLAILLLLAYHLFENEELITSMEVNYTPFSLEGFLCFSGFGNICVSMFVFLTAFGIARGWRDSGPRRACAGRALTARPPGGSCG